MNKQFYMLVRKGMVQRLLGKNHDGQPAKVWPIAESHTDAWLLAKWFKAQSKSTGDVRPAAIGSVNGETLEGHIKMAMDEGCVACYCVSGWNTDGSPIWKWNSLVEN